MPLNRLYGQKGVSFISLTDGINTTNASGKLLFHIIGALAELERGLISERTKAGMASARARGKHIGCPKLLTESSYPHAQRLLKRGMTRKQIAHELGVSINTALLALTSKDGISPAGRGVES